MAELRSTDIIGKLRKINQQISDLRGRLDGDVDIASTDTMTTSFVRNENTNIDGISPSNYSLEWYDGGWLENGYYLVKYGSSDIMSKANARIFIKILTGSNYVPTRKVVTTTTNDNQPQYHYIITLENKVYLIEFTSESQLLLRKVPIQTGAQISNDIEIDAENTQKAPSVKAMKDYVDSNIQPEVFIGSDQPTQPSYQIWVKI